MATNSKTILSQQIEDEQNRIREVCVKSRAIEYLALLGKVTQTKWYTDKQIAVALGEKTYAAITFLDKFMNQHYKRHQIGDLMRDDVSDIEAYKKKVAEFIYDEEKSVAIFSLMIDIINKWLIQNEKVIASDALKQIQRDIIEAHNTEFTKNHCVYHFYSDGEITSTKGGDIYGMRSTFLIAPPLKDKYQLELPLSHNVFSYAIVESEEIAQGFRNRLINLANIA